MVYNEINIELGSHYFTPILIEKIQNQVHQVLHSEVSEIYGMSKLIETILTKNKDICVASSGSINKINKSLTATNLMKYFNSNSIFSSQNVKNGKPAPDLFLFAAQKMGYSSEACIVIEDSLAGIKAALSANMKVIGFLGGSHAKYQWYEKNMKVYDIPLAHNSDELLKILTYL